MSSQLLKTALLLSVLFCMAPGQAQVQQDSADVARHAMRENLKANELQTQMEQEKPSRRAEGKSINPSADRGRGSQNVGAVVNYAVGATLIATGTKLMSNPMTVPTGVTLMTMGIIAVIQGDHDRDAAQASGRTFNASMNQGAGGTNSGLREDGASGSAFSDPRVKEAMNLLNQNGYSFTEKGLQNPDGSVTPIAAYDSASSMAAAGLDPATVEEAKKVLSVINEEAMKAKVVPVGIAGGPRVAPAAASASRGLDVDASGFSGGSFNPFALNEDQMRGLVAGKTVNFDGEPIGVARSNIFDIMHTAYQKRRGLRQFIETDSIRGLKSPEIRSPASLGGP